MVFSLEKILSMGRKYSLHAEENDDIHSRWATHNVSRMSVENLAITMLQEEMFES